VERHGFGRRHLRGALALLLPLLVVATEIPLPHGHDSSGVGLYDEQCPSLRLAAGASSLGPSPRPLTDLGTPLPATDRPDREPPLAVPSAPVSPAPARAPPIPA
jgi:hypothetical protein